MYFKFWITVFSIVFYSYSLIKLVQVSIIVAVVNTNKTHVVVVDVSCLNIEDKIIWKLNKLNGKIRLFIVVGKVVLSLQK